MKKSISFICCVIIILSYFSVSYTQAEKSQLQWFMHLSNFQLPAHIIKQSLLKKPIHFDMKYIDLTVQEILYDGMWLYGIAVASPKNTNDGLILPCDADSSDFVKGGHNENATKDERSFIEVSTQEKKPLILTKFHIAEMDNADYYFQDHRQLPNGSSVLFCGAPVQWLKNEQNITLIASTEILNSEDKKNSTAENKTIPFTIHAIGNITVQKYKPNTPYPLTSVNLIQTPLSIYPQFQFSKQTDIQNYSLKKIAPTNGIEFIKGVPPDSTAFLADDLPTTVQITLHNHTLNDDITISFDCVR